MPLSSLGVAQSALAAIRLASNESAFSKVSLHSIFFLCFSSAFPLLFPFRWPLFYWPLISKFSYQS